MNCDDLSQEDKECFNSKLVRLEGEIWQFVINSLVDGQNRPILGA